MYAKAVVAYASMYGNTREIAEALAEGLGKAEVVSVNTGDQPMRAAGRLPRNRTARSPFPRGRG